MGWDHICLGSGRIIALLVLFILLGIIFVGLELWQGDKSMLPGRVLKQRSVAAVCLFCFCSSGASFLLLYYIPMYVLFHYIPCLAWRDRADSLMNLQLVPRSSRDESLRRWCGHPSSGHCQCPILAAWWYSNRTAFGHSSFLVRNLFPSGQVCSPHSRSTSARENGLGTKFSSALAWVYVLKRRLWSPRMCLIWWIFLLGRGIVLLESILPEGENDKAINYCHVIDSAIFTGVAQSLFINHLDQNIAKTDIPSIDTSQIMTGGVMTLTNGLHGADKIAVLDAFNKAMVDMWLLPLALCCIKIIGAVIVERRKIRGREKETKESASAPV